jgi:hypothetical protein
MSQRVFVKRIWLFHVYSRKEKKKGKTNDDVMEHSNENCVESDLNQTVRWYFRNLLSIKLTGVIPVINLTDYSVKLFDIDFHYFLTHTFYLRKNGAIDLTNSNSSSTAGILS